MDLSRFQLRAWQPVFKDEDGDQYGGEMVYTEPAEVKRHIGFLAYKEDEPDNVIWMRCSGIKDSKGKLIFEGDIVKKGFEKYKVVFEDGMFAVRTRNYGFTTLFAMFDVEVIGNIYEHPELLKSDQVS